MAPSQHAAISAEKNEGSLLVGKGLQVRCWALQLMHVCGRAGVFRLSVSPDARMHNGAAASRITSLLTDALFGAIPSGAVMGTGRPLEAQVRCPPSFATSSSSPFTRWSSSIDRIFWFMVAVFAHFASRDTTRSQLFELPIMTTSAMCHTNVTNIPCCSGKHDLKSRSCMPAFNQSINLEVCSGSSTDPRDYL